MTTEYTQAAYAVAMETAAELLGMRLEPFVEPGPGEPGNARDFTQLATMHTFGDAWPRTEVLDVRTRALIFGDHRCSARYARATAESTAHRAP